MGSWMKNKLIALSITVLVVGIGLGCVRDKWKCDEKEGPRCIWLLAPEPPMEIQPEIGEMISSDEWKAAKSLDERRVLVQRSWASREKELTEGFRQIKGRVMKMIDAAVLEAKKNPKKRKMIYKQTKEEIQETTFGPATAALPIEEWVELLRERLGMKN